MLIYTIDERPSLGKYITFKLSLTIGNILPNN